MQKGGAAVVKALDAWSKKNLSKYKWLRGGIEVVSEVGPFIVRLVGAMLNPESVNLDSEVSHWQSPAEGIAERI